MPESEGINTPKEEQEILVVSEIWEEMQKMKPQTVRLEQVYLDPNNPRLESLKPEPIPEERLAEPGIQRTCLDQLKNFGVKDLVESIKTSGFCTIDRVVLRRLDSDKYVVVEGNRRVAALRVLREEHNKGRITLKPKSILDGISEFQALVYEGDRPDIAWIIQGFRHAPKAIKEWDDFSKAKFFAELERKGKRASDIAKAFSVRPRADVANPIRSYYGFQQAKEDEDYGDDLSISKFGLFKQVVFESNELKEWLGWDESTRQFKNGDNLKEFLSWAIPETEGVEPKIDISPTTRDYLPKLLMQPKHRELLDRFRRGELTLKECRIRMDAEEARIGLDVSGVLESIGTIKSSVNTLPISLIKGLGKTEEEKEQKKQILELLTELCNTLKEQISFIGAK